MSKLESFLARKDQDSLIVELSDANMASISGGALDPNSLKPQLAAQPTTQTNAAATGEPSSVAIGSPIFQNQVAIPTENLFSV